MSREELEFPTSTSPDLQGQIVPQPNYQSTGELALAFLLNPPGGESKASSDTDLRIAIFPAVMISALASASRSSNDVMQDKLGPGLAKDLRS